VRPHPPVEPDDLLARLVRRRPQVDVGIGIEGGVFQPGGRVGERPVERRAEVRDLDPGEVLDQPEQVGARRRARPSDVVLRQAVELADQRVATALEVAEQPRLGVVGQFECSISSIVWWVSTP
jgi:hypothetical protein